LKSSFISPRYVFFSQSVKTKDETLLLLLPKKHAGFILRHTASSLSRTLWPCCNVILLVIWKKKKWKRKKRREEEEKKQPVRAFILCREKKRENDVDDDDDDDDDDEKKEERKKPCVFNVVIRSKWPFSSFFA